MAERVAVFGAGGKMGWRILRSLRDRRGYELLPVEAGANREERLREAGWRTLKAEEAARKADIAVLAVPDVLIGQVAARVVEDLRPGRMIVCLAPAAPHAEKLPDREDVAVFVAHSCHPPVLNDETTPEAKADCFGGIAKQHVVAALMRGSEDDWERGANLARAMFAPVLRVHRVTVEQMAILEPALAETVVLTFLSAIRSALDEVVSRGVPEEAARALLLGHLHLDIGILFGSLNAKLSDGAKLAVRRGMEMLLRPEWKDVFTPESVRDQVRAIVHG